LRRDITFVNRHRANNPSLGETSHRVIMRSAGLDCGAVSISALMREDVEAADVMLTRLSELLRITLDRSEAQEAPFKYELDFVGTCIDARGSFFRDSKAAPHPVHGLERMQLSVLHPRKTKSWLRGCSHCPPKNSSSSSC
jgi:hypothetical protein